MRMQNGDVWAYRRDHSEDLEGSVELSKPQRIGLADLAASVLTCRSINTSELANILPRKVKSQEESYRYINRWLANDKIQPNRVMEGFIPELLETITEQGQIAVLMLDQSQVNKDFECLMVSLRIGETSDTCCMESKKNQGRNST